MKKIIFLGMVFIVIISQAYLARGEDKGQIDSFIEIGDAYRDKNDNIKALNAYKKAVSLNPESVVAHLRLGNLNTRLKRYDEAISEFSEAVFLDPDNSINILPVLISLYLVREDVRAVDYLKTLQTMNMQLAEDIYRQIFLSRFYGFKETEDGFIVRIPLFEVSDEKFSQYIQKADSYIDKEEYEKAILVYKEVVDKGGFLKQQKAVSCYIIGTLYAKINKHSEGIKYIEKAINLYPDEIFFKIGLIDAYRSLKDYSKGLKEIERLFKANPNDKYALFEGGVLYYESNEWQKAVESWDELKKIDKILFALAEEEYNRARVMTTK